MNTDQTREKQKFLRILCNFCLEPQQPYGFYFERYNWKALLKLAIFE